MYKPFLTHLYESSHFLTTSEAVALKFQFLKGNKNGYFVIKTTNDSVTCSILAIINLFYYISAGILAASQMSQMNGET